MKQIITPILLAAVGATAIISGVLFLNSCMIEERNEQSSSQTQTPQESSKEDQLQIEQNRLKELGEISESVKKELKQGELQVAKLKEVVANAQRLKDPDLIQKATLELKEWEGIVDKAKRLSQEVDAGSAETFSKIIKLIKEIKESKEI